MYIKQIKKKKRKYLNISNFTKYSALWTHTLVLRGVLEGALASEGH